MGRIQSRQWLAALQLLAIMALVAAAASFAAPALQRTVTEAFIKLTVVLGLYVFVAYGCLDGSRRSNRFGPSPKHPEAQSQTAIEEVSE